MCVAPKMRSLFSINFVIKICNFPWIVIRTCKCSSSTSTSSDIVLQAATIYRLYPIQYDYQQLLQWVNKKQWQNATKCIMCKYQFSVHTHFMLLLFWSICIRKFRFNHTLIDANIRNVVVGSMTVYMLALTRVYSLDFVLTKKKKN